ncbi:tripartite tricarboxylate transporter TctB family protein [Bosea caraganae]|nr:tripartite tricarboxylate transporter TctB family protein [Bosea caraganae]
MLQIQNIRQFWLGVLFGVIGLIALWELPRPIGTLTAMGPGYFPMLLGIGLVLAGAASIVIGIRSHSHTEVEPLSLVPTFFIISGIVAMALLIDRAGLAVSLLFMVLGTCYDRVLKHPIEVAVIYIAVLGMTWGVFLHLIKLPIKLFW